MIHTRNILLAAAAVIVFAGPAVAWAQTAPPAAVSSALRTGAADGPAGLLRALNEMIRRNPALVASPDAAAGLARAASQQVGGFVGGNLDASGNPLVLLRLT